MIGMALPLLPDMIETQVALKNIFEIIDEPILI